MCKGAKCVGPDAPVAALASQILPGFGVPFLGDLEAALSPSFLKEHCSYAHKRNLDKELGK